MKTQRTKKMTDERNFLLKLQDAATAKVISEYLAYSGVSPSVFAKQEKSLAPFFSLLQTRYFEGLSMTFQLATEAFTKTRFNEKRISYFNDAMAAYKKSLVDLFPQAGNIWVLDGLVFQNQLAGMKNLVGLAGTDGSVIDVLNSATSLSLGAENPWLVKMDYVEDLLGVRDNICAAYHPGIRQAFVLAKLSELYPNKQVTELSVHTESSGTIVNSVAIESAVAFAEKYHKNGHDKKILAVDGTWAGGYGAAREGTGFGVDDYQVKRAGKNIWVDRCLPPPIKENVGQFITILREKLAQKQIAGIYLEPDVVGDLGLVSVDPGLLRQVKKFMLEEHLPIIFDSVQQLGRSGSYWGENVDNIFADFPLLVMTTAKSASNGQPFGFTVMPKIISDCAYPLSQITTNQMNGPLFRSLVVAEIMRNDEFQSWLTQKSRDIEKIAGDYDVHQGHLGLRGKYLNRGIYLEDDEHVKLAQIALLIEDGILVGATPHSIRYQPMLLEYSETNSLIANIIFRRLQQIKLGNISTVVLQIFEKMHGVETGLARKNT